MEKKIATTCCNFQCRRYGRKIPAAGWRNQYFETPAEGIAGPAPNTQSNRRPPGEGMNIDTTRTHRQKEKWKLPNGWRWVRLGEICELNPHRPMIERQDSEPTSFIPMESIDAVSGTISDLRARPFGEVKKGYTYFSDGDVLFAKITPCMQNGKHAIAQRLLDGIGFGTTEFHVLRPSQYVCSEWIHFFIRQPVVLHDATNHFTGAVGQQRVPDEFLRSLEIPLPSLPEQQRIARVLHEQMVAVEKARTAAQARLEAVKALPAAYLRQVFPQSGQPLPDGWRSVKLGEVCEIIAGQSPPGSTYLSMPEGLPFFQGKADFGKVKPVARVWCAKPIKIAQPGDILISIRAPVGPTNVADTECCIGRGLAAIRCGETADRDFILNALRNFEARLVKKGSGSTFEAINRDDLKSFEIPIPTLPEQRRIAEVLKKQMSTVEMACTAAEVELAAINALPAALFRRAFNGEL